MGAHLGNSESWKHPRQVRGREAGVWLCCRSDGIPHRRAGLGTRQEASQDGGPEQAQPKAAPERESIEERNWRLSDSTAAMAAAGAWDFRSGVPFTYDGQSTSKLASSRPHEPQLTRTQRPPPVPKLAPLPPVPGAHPFPSPNT